MLNFNGAYNCSGSGDVLNCNIFCPKGITFEYAPAALYSCNYADGGFVPKAVPQCVIGKCSMIRLHSINIIMFQDVKRF